MSATMKLMKKGAQAQTVAGALEPSNTNIPTSSSPKPVEPAVEAAASAVLQAEPVALEDTGTVKVLDPDPGDPQEAAMPTKTSALSPTPPGPKKKTAKKTTLAVAVQDSLVGEIIHGDPISQTAQAIENLSENVARDMVGKLLAETEFTYFRLGGVLAVIQSNGWFAPHASFKDYIENEVGIQYRRAMYFVSIYTKLVELQIPWETFKSIGWSKLKELLPVLTADNADDWVKVAESSTVQNLIAIVKSKQAKAAGELTDDSEGAAKIVTSVSFKLHDDQKATVQAALDKAKEELSTSVATVALEHICMDYLAGSSTPGAKGIKNVTPLTEPEALVKAFSQVGYEKVLEAFEKAFPEIDLVASIND